MITVESSKTRTSFFGRSLSSLYSLAAVLCYSTVYYHAMHAVLSLRIIVKAKEPVQYPQLAFDLVNGLGKTSNILGGDAGN
jgi:hypothetical protein